MKVMMIAVFSSISTNNAQADGFEKHNCEVIRYNYRVRANEIGRGQRDQEIIDICKKHNFYLCQNFHNPALR